MRRQRRTKIVATLGPASSDRAVIAKLFAAGADVFRINMSHASHDAMRERVATGLQWLSSPRYFGGVGVARSMAIWIKARRFLPFLAYSTPKKPS